MSEQRKQWPLYEVFIRARSGLEHKHVGSIHAVDERTGGTLWERRFCLCIGYRRPNLQAPDCDVDRGRGRGRCFQDLCWSRPKPRARRACGRLGAARRGLRRNLARDL